jgi:DNA primase
MADGAAGLAYLRARGLTDETIKRFGLGWSGEGRGALANALGRQGIKVEQLVEAGLMKQGDYGPVDMFFSRVMFPIQDRRGQIISFSGRVLGDGQPKYVNGPETPAFSKRRSLYGVNFAREAVRKGDAVIVVEGQMDVISLAQAGFGGAVAPLGTALTEDHLSEIWRLSPEPVVCFDADNAGRRAAMRTVDLALSALASDRGLRFLQLPEKDDPDSLIRREGPESFKARLDKATPISEALFGMLAEGVSKDTPEARAAFHARLLSTADRIPDKALAREYRAILLGRFFGDWRPKRHGKIQGNADANFQSSKTERNFDKSQRITIKPRDADKRRGYVILSILIQFPELFRDFEEALFLISSFEPTGMEIFRILQDFLESLKDSKELIDNERFQQYLEGYGIVEKARQVVATAAEDYRPDPTMAPAQAAEEIWHFYYLMQETISNLEKQRDDARADFLNNPGSDECLTRLVKLEEYLMYARAGEFGQSGILTVGAGKGRDDQSKVRQAGS